MALSIHASGVIRSKVSSTWLALLVGIVLSLATVIPAHAQHGVATGADVGPLGDIEAMGAHGSLENSYRLSCGPRVSIK